MAGQWLLERTDRPYAEVIRFDAIGSRSTRSGGWAESSTWRARSEPHAYLDGAS
jgi:hypothetical protein